MRLPRTIATSLPPAALRPWSPRCYATTATEDTNNNNTSKNSNSNSNNGKSTSSDGRRKPRLGHTLSLEHFVQRSRALSLYRTICRGCNRIRDPTTREETRGFARAEFERHRDVTDLGHIRYLLSTGKTEWDGMQRYIGSM